MLNRSGKVGGLQNSRSGSQRSVTRRANPQVVNCDMGRADGRAAAIFGSVELSFNSLENRCASYWRTGSSNLPPSVLSWNAGMHAFAADFGQIAVFASRADSRWRLLETARVGLGLARNWRA